MTRKMKDEGASQTAARPPSAQAPSPGDGGNGNNPVHSIRLRNVRASIWANQAEQGVFYSVKITRFYKDAEGEWRNSDSFGRDDLLLASKAADLARTGICEPLQATPETPFEGQPGTDRHSPGRSPVPVMFRTHHRPPLLDDWLPGGHDG